MKACATGPNVRFLSLIRATGRGLIDSLEHFSIRLTPTMLSSPGLSGRSSKHRPWLLDCPVKPGNDTVRVKLTVKCSNRQNFDRPLLSAEPQNRSGQHRDNAPGSGNGRSRDQLFPCRYDIRSGI